MNNVRKGFRRDRQILQELERCKVLNTYQITSLLFQGKSSLRKAQQRLKKLADQKAVKRTRTALDEPFAYYLHSATGRFDHLIAVNWVYTWVVKNLASWETLWCWEYEPGYGILRPDAFFGIRNSVTGTVKFHFVELDRSHNAWDKTKKYNELYRSGTYLNSYWVPHSRGFPAVLCVTDSLARLRFIQKSIEEENTEGLEFRVMPLADIVKEAMPDGA